MPDDLEAIAEQVVDTIQDAREEAAEEIKDADERADVLARLDGLEAKAVAIEGSVAALPSTIPEHSHDDITSKLDELLSKTAEAVEDVTEPVTEPVSDVIDTTADAITDAAPSGGGDDDDKPAEPKEPERRHSLFSKPFAHKRD